MSEPNNVGKLIYLMSREMRYVISMRLRRQGLMVIDYEILSLLLENAPLSQEFLVELAIVEKSTVAKSLRRLEQKDIIRRSVDQHDRRKRWIDWGSQSKGVLTTISNIRNELDSVLYIEVEDDSVLQTLSSMANSLHQHVVELRRQE